jgi:hypothetical protein
MLIMNKKWVTFSMNVHGWFPFFLCLIGAPRHCPAAGPYTPSASLGHCDLHSNMSSEPLQASSADAEMLDAATALVAAHATVGPNVSLGECTQLQTNVRSITTIYYSALTLHAFRASVVCCLLLVVSVRMRALTQCEPKTE